MKKTVIAAAIMAVSVVNVSAENEITVTVNGSSVAFDQPPVIENDRTLVPLRAIFEALGAEVDWNDETRTVTAEKNDVKISLTIDNAYMKVGEENVKLDTPAKIINDRTMVPVRAISEAFMCDVQWDGDTRQVIITSEEPSVAPSLLPESTISPSSSPAAGTEPSSSPEATEVPFAKPIEAKIEDNVNIFDTAWIVDGKEINAADGNEKDNAKLCATDYIPVNAGKSYYAGYYDPNNFKFVGGYCVNYAFYDSEKKFISGEAADMAKVVKAPDYASYVRYTIKLEPTSERAKLYLTFMQTEKAPEEFKKSEAVLKLAETEAFRDKKIFIAGDQQIQNAGPWTKVLDKKLGAGVVGVKGIWGLRFYISDYTKSLCNDETINTFPKDADYIIINAGFYDWTISGGIGTNTSSNGGIYDFISLAKSKWPKSQLVMMTLPNAKYASDEFTSAGLYNKLGMSTKDYSEDIKEACSQENIPVIDISDLWTKDNMETYMKQDNLSYLYPNDEGGELIAERVYERLLELESK